MLSTVREISPERERAKEGPTVVTGQDLPKHTTLPGVLKDAEGRHLLAERGC